MTENGSAALKFFDSFAKLDRLVDIQQMVRMFKEAANLFRGETATKSEDEIVVGELSFNLTLRDAHFPFEWIDVNDFRFDEIHSSIQQRVAQVE